MVDIVQTASAYMPNFRVYGSLLLTMLMYLGILIAISIIAGFIIYYYIQKKKFRNTIVIFEKINGRWTDTGKDKAMEIPLKDIGGTIFYCKRRKKYLPMPSLQSGVRKFYFAIREDGEWINIQLEDIDFKSKMLNISFIDKDMRYANKGIAKLLKDRFNKSSIWKEYAPIIVSVVFILIIAIATYLLFDKWIELANITNQGMQLSNEVIKAQNEVLSKLDIVQAGGSGIVKG